ncbi:hypothetical protein BUALT_Bualt19G0055500 [Buddleja alternifolia]|uniref:FMR1-interacting protein 1 conserved domain-containing protein n=1 Tax=Buddleja alternifolia TaxID=168488 RepID=A0AAV6W5Q7_9LAMI|nr:hypothetical protein BUALT_Bualt19G0055500 [Buddleja alternifolia]
MGNPGNFCPNPMEIRPQFQMGTFSNAQLAMPPFTNQNTFFAPNQFLPFPQAPLHNLNTNNLSQLFAHNAVNPPQFLPNGQLNVPNLVQNVNHLLQMQMQMQMRNCGPPNSGLFMNAHTGMANGNGVVQQSVNGDALKHMKPNAAVAKDSGSPQAKDNQNVFSRGAATSQNNAGFVNGVSDRNNSWRKPHSKNFVGNPKPQRGGFGKRQFNHRQNGQGSFKFNNENRGKGNKNIEAKKSNSYEQVQVGEKRSLALNYTEKEIQQWRAERRKNHPSNANKKRLTDNPTQPEATDEVAKIRRQQLKEILAKQAELGCEVAEIPSCYLSDAEVQRDGRQQYNKVYGKRGRFHNKGRFHKNDRFSQRQRRDPKNDSVNFQDRSGGFAKKQRLANDKREPSLLKKLLSSDIKRDKKHLLQVFRFMVMNSFFEDLPGKPLKFPVVIVKESSDGSEIAEEKPEMRLEYVNWYAAMFIQAL